MKKALSVIFNGSIYYPSRIKWYNETLSLRRKLKSPIIRNCVFVYTVSFKKQQPHITSQILFKIYKLKSDLTHLIKLLNTLCLKYILTRVHFQMITPKHCNSIHYSLKSLVSLISKRRWKCISQLTIFQKGISHSVLFLKSYFNIPRDLNRSKHK